MIGFKYLDIVSVPQLLNGFLRQAGRSIENNILDFALYVSLFPQLIAGPIVHYKDVAVQINDRPESIDMFLYGMKMGIVGHMDQLIVVFM